MPTPDPLDVTIALMLRRRRRAMKLTWAQLGAAVGITAEQVKAYENATNRVPASTLARMAPVLGTTVYVLLGYAPWIDEQGEPDPKG